MILSEMLGALATAIAEATAEERNAAVMVGALREATDASYAAVGTPVEGTILSVCRAAAEAAEARAPSRGPAPATCSPPRPPPPARRWPGRRTSCRRCATPGSSTPAAAACA